MRPTRCAPIRSHTYAALLALAASAACAPTLDHGAPASLTWLSPTTDTPVFADGPLPLVVQTADPAARVVHFAVDGVEVGACDATAPDQDCHRAEQWSFTTVVTGVGNHVLTAWFDADGARVEIGEAIAVADEATTTVLGDDPDASVVLRDDDAGGATDAAAPMHVVRDRGFLDPDRGWHNVFGGVAWRVDNEHVVLHSGEHAGSQAAIAACMHRYGDAIRHSAGAYHVSTASIVATAMAESNCTDPGGSSDGLSSGPMQVTASTCAAVTHTSAASCRARMHSEPAFSFDVGARFMASAYQVAQHHHDPPKMAAAYNAGSLQATGSNAWHLVSTGNHIDRWTQAYNAYARWLADHATALSYDEPDRVFDGEHVATVGDLPATATEGQTYFVGDWAARDGAFYAYVRGAWRSSSADE